MSTFQGLPPGLFTLFIELEPDNSKAFWQANKIRWERNERAPMRTLLAELGGFSAVQSVATPTGNQAIEQVI